MKRLATLTFASFMLASAATSAIAAPEGWHTGPLLNSWAQSTESKFRQERSDYVTPEGDVDVTAIARLAYQHALTNPEYLKGLPPRYRTEDGFIDAFLRENNWAYGVAVSFVEFQQNVTSYGIYLPGGRPGSAAETRTAEASAGVPAPRPRASAPAPVPAPSAVNRKVAALESSVAGTADAINSLTAQQRAASKLIDGLVVDQAEINAQLSEVTAALDATNAALAAQRDEMQDQRGELNQLREGQLSPEDVRVIVGEEITVAVAPNGVIGQEFATKDELASESWIAKIAAALALALAFLTGVVMFYRTRKSRIERVAATAAAPETDETETIEHVSATPAPAPTARPALVERPPLQPIDAPDLSALNEGEEATWRLQAEDGTEYVVQLTKLAGEQVQAHNIPRYHDGRAGEVAPWAVKHAFRNIRKAYQDGRLAGCAVLTLSGAA